MSEAEELRAALEAVAMQSCCQESCTTLGEPPPDTGRTCADVNDSLCAVCIARQALTGDRYGGKYRRTKGEKP